MSGVAAFPYQRLGSDPATACVQAPDLDLARIFYCDGLTFTLDPGTWSKQRGGFGVLWFNLGRHQVGPLAINLPWSYCMHVETWTSARRCACRCTF